MADTTIGNWFDKVFFDAHGEPCAGGTLYFYQTGTDIPLGVTTAGGVLLGACVRLDDDGRPVDDFRFYADRSYRVVLKDADGAVVKQIDDVCIAQTEGGGMLNPMAALGDLIVGGTDGEPARLGVGSAGKILTSNGTTATWEAPAEQEGDHKIKVDALDSEAGYLVQKLYGGTMVNVSTAYDGGGYEHLQVDLATAGSLAGDVLTADGNGGATFSAPAPQPGDHKVSADGTDTAGYLEDKIGAGSGISLATSAGKVVVSADTQPGDHKTAVDGADASPDYLAAKLAAGSGISLTNTGSAVEIAATAQTGDHQLLVSATDAAAGYLGAKLTAGSNVTLTPQTDGDGVQTLEISATGGGGGGGVDEFVKWTQEFVGATGTTAMSNTQSIVLKCYADTDMIPEEVVLPCDHQYANTTYKAFIVVGTETFSSSTVSFSGSVSVITPATTPPRVAHIPLTGKNGFTKIAEGKTYFLVFGKSVGSTSEYFKQDYGVTLYHARTYAGAITETPNWAWNNASAQTGLPIVGLKFKRE